MELLFRVLEESGWRSGRAILKLVIKIFWLIYVVRDYDSLGCSVLRVYLDVSPTALLSFIVIMMRMMMLGSTMMIRGRVVLRFTVARGGSSSPW